MLLDGQPERLLIEREGEPLRARFGETWRGRVRTLSRGFRGAFVDLGLERDGFLRLAAGEAPSEGEAVEVEVVSEGRRDKAPGLKWIGRSPGPPARLAEAPSLEARLKGLEPQAPLETGEAAREAADEAEEAVLARVSQLGGGVSITIDRTRALTAVDVDLGDAAANRKTVAGANRAAVFEAARLLRLKGLGGLVVIDLVGAARDHAAVNGAAREAFAPDEPGMVFAGVSRLGLLEIAKPWRERPVGETLLDADGALSPRTMAHRLLRALEREGRFDPGSRLVGFCAPEVASEAAPFVSALGPRFSIEGEVGRSRSSTDIRRR